MHAYLIVGSDDEFLIKKAEELALQKKSRLLNYEIDKIEKVRELAGFLKLSQKEPSAIFIKNVDSATNEALNAFLKNLEEPSANIIFILTAKNEHKVLQTIVSRCQIIRSGQVKSKEEEIDSREISAFLNGTAGERLSVISNIKNREDAKVFLERLLQNIHYKLVNEIPGLKYATSLKIIQETLNRIDLNGNVSLQLTNLVVKLENN